MDLDFTPAFAGWADLLRGAEITIGVTAASLLLGCLLGMLIGIGRLNPKRRLVYGICTAYVTLIRGKPLLVQLFILFYGLPQFGVLLPTCAASWDWASIPAPTCRKLCAARSNRWSVVKWRRHGLSACRRDRPSCG